jgi:hypothetical protein
MDEMNQLKVFTVGEANQLLPRLTALIRELQERRATILSMEVEIDAMELVSEKDDSGAAPKLASKVDEYTHIVNRFYSLLDEFHSTGCFLKDLDIGLVDFYTLHKGRVVYLCWKIGENGVSHWHEVGKGFASREPIISE